MLDQLHCQSNCKRISINLPDQVCFFQLFQKRQGNVSYMIRLHAELGLEPQIAVGELKLSRGVPDKKWTEIQQHEVATLRTGSLDAPRRLCRDDRHLPVSTSPSKECSSTVSLTYKGAPRFTRTQCCSETGAGISTMSCRRCRTRMFCQAQTSLEAATASGYARAMSSVESACLRVSRRVANLSGIRTGGG